MITYDKHQCTINFLCIAKINCNLYQFIPICLIARKDFKHAITTCMVLTVIRYKEFSFKMIADHKHQCTIHFLCNTEINCNDEYINHFMPLCHYVGNDFNDINTGTNCNNILRHFLPK